MSLIAGLITMTEGKFVKLIFGKNQIKTHDIDVKFNKLIHTFL